MNPEQFDNAMVYSAKDAERVERLAWADYFLATPKEWFQEFGGACQKICGAAVIASPLAPVVQFNRAWCLGIDEPAHEAQLKEIMRFFAGLGITHYAIQVAPFEQSPEIKESLSSLGFRVQGSWLRLMSRLDRIPLSDSQSELRIEVVEQKHKAAFGRIIQEGFGAPPPFQIPASCLVERPNLAMLNRLLRRRSRSEVPPILFTATWHGGAFAPPFRTLAKEVSRARSFARNV